MEIEKLGPKEPMRDDATGTRDKIDGEKGERNADRRFELALDVAEHLAQNLESSNSLDEALQALADAYQYATEELEMDIALCGDENGSIDLQLAYFAGEQYIRALQEGKADDSINYVAGVPRIFRERIDALMAGD